jgi:hypothetical protein
MPEKNGQVPGFDGIYASAKQKRTKEKEHPRHWTMRPLGV